MSHLSWQGGKEHHGSDRATLIDFEIRTTAAKDLNDCLALRLLWPVREGDIDHNAGVRSAEAASVRVGLGHLETQQAI